jgi:hypothetical protein
MTKAVVSFEGLPSLLRDTVARQVGGAQAMGRAAVPGAAATDGDAFAMHVVHMLDQLKAVAAAPDGSVVCTASWLDKVPATPGQRALYYGLLEAAAARLGVDRAGGGRHHAVCLHTDLHETFEELMELGADFKHVGLEDLRALDDRVRGEHVAHTVFPVTYHHVNDIGKYATDCLRDTDHAVQRAAKIVESLHS